MRKILIISILFSCSSCTSSEPSTPNEALEQFYQAWADEDIDKMISLSINDETLKIIKFEDSKEDAIDFLKTWLRAKISPLTKEVKDNLIQLAIDVKSLNMISFKEHLNIDNRKTPQVFAIYFLEEKDLENAYLPLIVSGDKHIPIGARSSLVLHVNGKWMVGYLLFALQEGHYKKYKQDLGD